ESGLAVNDTATGHPQLNLASYSVTGAALDTLARESTQDQAADSNMTTLRSALGHAIGITLPTVSLFGQDYADTATWQDLGTGVSHTYTTNSTPATVLHGDTVEVLGGIHDGHVYRYLGTGIPTMSVSALDG